MKNQSTKGKGALLDSLQVSVKAPTSRVVYSLAGIPVATAGNLCVVAAQPKAGKSSLIGAFLGAAMHDDLGSAIGDMLGVTSNDYQGHALIHFDTEQSQVDHATLLETARKRAGVDAIPPWLRSYRLTQIPTHQRMALLDFELARRKKADGGIHSVILDGVADMLVNPNDSEKSFALASKLHLLASKYDTAIICVLHVNPGKTVKTRGHLGSQLERKSETNIMIEKIDGISTVFTQSSRHAPISRLNGPQFRWNEEAKMHLLWKWEWK